MKNRSIKLANDAKQSKLEKTQKDRIMIESSLDKLETWLKK